MKRIISPFQSDWILCLITRWSSQWNAPFPNFDLTLFHDMMNLKFPEWRNPNTRLGPARCCLRPARATKFQGSFSGTFPNFDLTLFHDMMNLKFPQWRNPDTRLGPARCCLRPPRATKFQGSFSGTFNYHRTTSNCIMSGANHFADIRWSCPWNTFHHFSQTEFYV